MTQWEGRLIKVADKDWNAIKLWSFQIEGVDRWFRTGTTKIPFDVDDLIVFEERNNKVILESIVKVSTQPVSDAPIPTATTESVSSTPSAPPAGDVGRRIQWQAARRDACNVMVAALAADAMPWATNLAKGKKLDALRGYINELTKQFIEEELS